MGWDGISHGSGSGLAEPGRGWAVPESENFIGTSSTARLSLVCGRTGAVLLPQHLVRNPTGTVLRVQEP